MSDDEIAAALAAAAPALRARREARDGPALDAAIADAPALGARWRPGSDAALERLREALVDAMAWHLRDDDDPDDPVATYGFGDRPRPFAYWPLAVDGMTMDQAAFERLRALVDAAIDADAARRLLAAVLAGLDGQPTDRPIWSAVTAPDPGPGGWWGEWAREFVGAARQLGGLAVPESVMALAYQRAEADTWSADLDFLGADGVLDEWGADVDLLPPAVVDELRRRFAEMDDGDDD